MSETLRFPHDAEVLKHFTRLELSTTPMSESKFSSLLAAAYHDLVPDFSRNIKSLRDWREMSGEELQRAHSANEKQFTRYMDDSIMIPLELVRPWIKTLDKFRKHAIVAIYAHNDFLPVKVPSACVLSNVTAVCAEYADYLKSMTPILADGKVDSEDLPHIPGAIHQIDQLLSVVSSVREQLSRVNSRGRSALSVVENGSNNSDGGGK